MAVDTKDGLTLQIDSPSLESSMPYPSPGSGFLPPPIPQAHEFALTPPPPPTKRKVEDQQSSPTTNKRASTGAGSFLLGQQQQEAGPSTPRVGSQSVDLTSMMRTFSAPNVIQPTPSTNNNSTSTPPTNNPRDSTSIHNKHLSRSSLHSTRPAPASPSNSRRTSRAISTISTSSIPSNNKRQSSRISFVVKIRDYAFSKTDERFFGKGPDAPGKEGEKRQSTESNNRKSGGGGWAGFRWSGLGNRFSWSFMSSPSSSPSGNNGNNGSNSRRSSSGLINSFLTSPDEYTPSKQDFDRNFDSPPPSSPARSTSPPLEEDEGVEEGPLLPGYYRALYAFVPEGLSEMALEEEQVVKIVGRGGGVGWAIAVKEEEGGGHALVPESYLEYLRPLEDEGGEEGGDEEDMDEGAGGGLTPMA